MEEIVKNEDVSKTTVEIDIELLKKIRNLLEVANSRIHWKIEELLAVGLTIKEMDEKIKSVNM